MARRNVIEILIEAKNRAGTQLREVGVGLDKLSTLALAGGFAFAGMRIAETAIDLSKLGAQAERLETSFRRLAGTDADEMLERLRAASRGTIDDMNLMLSANRAMMLGVTDSADTMARLLEVATVRGRAMGLTTQQAFNDLMTGIGRTSPMILDNLGIVTGGVKVYDDFAASIGKATADLSAAEKRLALVNKVLAETSGTAAPDAAEGFETLSASSANLRTELGKLLDSVAEGVGILGSAVASVSKAVSEINLFTEGMAQAQNAIERANKAGVLSEESYRRLSAEINIVALAHRRGTISTEEANEEFARITERTGLYRAELTDINAVMRESREIVILRTKAVREARKAEEAFWATAMAGIDWAREFGGVLELTYEEHLSIRAQQFKSEIAMREEAQAEQERLDRIAEREAEQHTQRLEALWEQHQQKLRSLIEEALFAPTQVTDRDWWETNLGQYEDKPDEFIRRLKSAATDAESAWRHLIPMEIMEQGGDAIRLYVAQMEDLFRAGRWEELKERAPEFDPAQAIEAAVRQVRERVMAERARAALIAQVLAHPEIRALGLTVQEQIDVGMAQPEIGGAALAEQTAAGFKTFDSGAVFIQTFKAQVLARQDEIVMIGQTVATYIAMGFRDLTPDTAYNWAEALGPALFDWLEGRGAFGGRP